METSIKVKVEELRLLLHDLYPWCDFTAVMSALDVLADWEPAHPVRLRAKRVSIKARREKAGKNGSGV